MAKKSYYIVSLGCAKNEVDSESMAQLLNRGGYHPVKDPAHAEMLVVNTCGFIAAAREESLRTLQEFAKIKRKGQKLIAAGCLTQRYGLEVLRQVPEIDAILGTRRWMDILEIVERLHSGEHPRPLYHLPTETSLNESIDNVLRASIHGGSAYLKIADGCRRPCAFCAIPLIKGRAVSRPMELILQEAQALQDWGIREIVLIAQDTTDYGSDLGMKDGLTTLLKRMTSLLEQTASPEKGGVEWVRILYAYPGCVTDALIETMASRPQIVHYLDMPLQHAHPEVLRRMRRPSNIEWVHRTIEKVRNAMPDVALRTTFIVGYPGETEQEFQALLDFIQEVRFDHVGVFQFSFEIGTPSESLGDPIPPEIKQERYERLMETQQRISLEKNQTLVGRILEVLIEGQGDGISVGRTYRDAPEIDGLVIIEGEHPVGEIIPVYITGAMHYDLSGKAIQQKRATQRTEIESNRITS